MEQARISLDSRRFHFSIKGLFITWQLSINDRTCIFNDHKNKIKKILFLLLLKSIYVKNIY